MPRDPNVAADLRETMLAKDAARGKALIELGGLRILKTEEERAKYAFLVDSYFREFTQFMRGDE